ncbi:hypothetical protein CDAR_278981 [Caerostris darwini]|uniref:Uncharacterized protein n=1 Tax=Caerostris darwini TaxID=1538125 RepID=A0AAV4WQD7_9ARAC|nr:hypothetical protein CDAR_278981 [Caerostris darwini]
MFLLFWRDPLECVAELMGHAFYKCARQLTVTVAALIGTPPWERRAFKVEEGGGVVAAQEVLLEHPFGWRVARSKSKNNSALHSYCDTIS